MAASATPKPTPADFPSLDALPGLGPTDIAPFFAAPFAVALSGGADSTALLVACALRWPSQVRAIHVHHGLQAAADQFALHCETLCTQWQVPLTQARVDARHAPGESPEDAARRARYAALAQAAHAQGVQHVLLAQHADDQVETVLLALSRGAGLAGLAARPTRMMRGGITFHRPWLQASGASLRDALRRLHVHWEEDPTNTDTRYTRNRIRADVLPALAQAFPSYRQTFARSAAHAAQAQALLEEVAAADLVQVGDPPSIRGLQNLSHARLVNVLRHWLRLHHQPASSAQLRALVAQVRACVTRGHGIDLKVGQGFVRRDGEVLRCYNL